MLSGGNFVISLKSSSHSSAGNCIKCVSLAANRKIGGQFNTSRLNIIVFPLKLSNFFNIFFLKKLIGGRMQKSIYVNCLLEKVVK